MKKLWKALGITALAALVPVRIKKDEETGKRTFQSLLWKVDVAPGENGEGTDIGLGLMDGVLTAPLMNAITAKEEAELFTDDPAEATPFVDEELEAPVVEAVTEKVEAAAEEFKAKAEEFETKVKEFEAKAEEFGAKAKEFEAKAEEAVEADFDPEF